MEPLRVAMIDEDPTSRQLFRHWLQSKGYRLQEVASEGQLGVLLESLPDIVCVDLSFDGERGLSLLREIHTLNPDLPVIAVSNRKDAETAVLAMRAGANDYISKPLDAQRLKAALERAESSRNVRSSVERLSHDLEGRTLKGLLGGHTPAAKELDGLIARVLSRDVAVCMNAERGSGADLVAQAIHQGGARCHGPFVELDCAALDESAQEVALFGEEKGGQVISCGVFERGNGGVVHLQEVGALSLRAQACLAQTLSDKVVRRVGGHDSVSVNVRVTASHAGELRSLVESGKFREELYFRLVVYPVRVPPLRERKDDLPLIVSQLLRKLAPESRVQMAPEALEALMRYSWPGNLQELEHVVHRSLLAAEDEVIAFSDLPDDLRESLRSDRAPCSERRSEQDWMKFPEGQVVPLRELEKRAIEHALRVTGGSVSVAAQKLGIGRATLYRRIASFDLSQSVA